MREENEVEDGMKNEIVSAKEMKNQVQRRKLRERDEELTGFGQTERERERQRARETPLPEPSIR